MKKLLIMLVITLTLVGCLFESGDEKAPVSSSSSLSSMEEVSSSSSVEASNRLTIPGQAVGGGLKRVTLDGYYNRIISKETVQGDSVYGDYDVVTINWGVVDTTVHNFTYYLSVTGDQPVQMDSVVTSEDSLRVNKPLTGFEVITDKIGMTGDEILPLVYNNQRFHKRGFDSTITMTVYGTELNTGKRTKLEVRFLVGSVVTRGLYEGRVYGYDSVFVHRTKPMSHYKPKEVQEMDTSWVLYPSLDEEGLMSIDVADVNKLERVKDPLGSIEMKIQQFFWLDDRTFYTEGDYLLFR